MRHHRSLVVAGSLVASVASAQETPPAKAPATPPAVAAGSTQNSAAGSISVAGSTTTTTTDAPAKPARRAPRKAKKPRVVTGPVANFPSFRVLPDGSSRIHVAITEKVIVAERKAEGRVAYRLKGVSVPVRTNLLPLETSFFKTPVARVTLVEAGDEDIELVVELRQPTAITYKTVDTDAGMLLQIDVPAPAQQTPQPPAK